MFGASAESIPDRLLEGSFSSPAAENSALTTLRFSMPTKARFLILRWNRPGSINHLCGELAPTMISKSNSLAVKGGRAPNQHVRVRLHPTGLPRLLCMRAGLDDLPVIESQLPHPPQPHRVRICTR